MNNLNIVNVATYLDKMAEKQPYKRAVVNQCRMACCPSPSNHSAKSNCCGLPGMLCKIHILRTY